MSELASDPLVCGFCGRLPTEPYTLGVCATWTYAGAQRTWHGQYLVYRSTWDAERAEAARLRINREGREER